MKTDPGLRQLAGVEKVSLSWVFLEKEVKKGLSGGAYKPGHRDQAH